MVMLTEWARHWPAGHFWVAGPSDWWLIGLYGGLALWAAGFVRPPRRWSVAMSGRLVRARIERQLGSAAGWTRSTTLARHWNDRSGSPRAMPTPGPPDGDRRRLDCTFVSVGHGSAVVLRLPGGQTLLYDAGCMGDPTYGERAISAVLWSKGIRHLDAVILSHADADHYNALPGLLKKFSAGIVYVTPLMFDRPTPRL